MILSVTFSKPVLAVSDILGSPYTRIKIKLLTASPLNANGKNTPREYLMEQYTQKQVFHKRLSEGEVDAFIKEHAGTTFKNCVQRTEKEEITILASKKGKITRLSKPLASPLKTPPAAFLSRQKQYLLQEGTPVPFLIHLGVMTDQGKVIQSKYDKFRQINRFLECVDDILPSLTAKAKDRPLRIIDFGSGKSYLTFAVHYLLTEIRHIPCEITGLDLKEDVISYCNTLARQFNCKTSLSRWEILRPTGKKVI